MRQSLPKRKNNEAKSDPKRILLVRPDRIGDVVLSIPVVKALRCVFPKAEISFLARDYVLPVLERIEGLSEPVIYRPEHEHRGWSGLGILSSTIAERRFDVAIALQVQALPTFAVYRARVPIRIGPVSKWYSRFCFTEGIVQNRSKVEAHEAQYGLDLLGPLGISPDLFDYRPELQKRGSAQGSYVVVHPGMGNSALNLKEEVYRDLIGRLSGRAVPVVLTGSERERALIDRLKGNFPHVETRVTANDNNGLRELLDTLEGAVAVVAPSTGPLHLAAALGKPVISFYPPIRVQSAKRWGPVPNQNVRSYVFSPEADCAEVFSCAGKKCHRHYCMDEIQPEDIASRVEQLVAVTKSHR